MELLGAFVAAWLVALAVAGALWLAFEAFKWWASRSRWRRK